MSTPIKPIFYGWWVLVGVSTMVFMGFGCFYALPLFYPSLTGHLGWTRAQVSLTGSILLALAGLASPFVGILIDRWGTRYLFIGGTVLVAIAVAWLSQVRSLPELYASAVVFGVGLAGFSILPTQVIISKWFVRKRGIATGLACSGMELGGAVASLVVAASIADRGYKASFLLEAACLLLVSLPIGIWVLREKPQNFGMQPYGASGGLGIQAHKHWTSAGHEFTFPEAIRTGSFWFLSLSIFCAMFTSIAIIQELALYLQTVHVDLETASYLLSILLFASVAGRVALGYVSDHLGGPRTLFIAYLLLAGGTVFLLLVRSKAWLMVMAILVGFGYGGTLVMITLTAIEIFGSHAIGKILGTILLFFSAGASLGPIAVGYLADHPGGYHSAFLALVTLAVLAVLAASGVRPVEPLAASRSNSKIERG